MVKSDAYRHLSTDYGDCIARFVRVATRLIRIVQEYTAFSPCVRSPHYESLSLDRVGNRHHYHSCTITCTIYLHVGLYILVM